MAAKLKTFVFTGQCTVSIFTKVEAEDEERAREIAEERPLQSLCHRCSSRDEDGSWALSGALDGTAEEIKLDD